MTLPRRAFVLNLAGGAFAILGRLATRRRCGTLFGKPDSHALGLAYLAAGGSRRSASGFLTEARGIARRSGYSVGAVVGRLRTADFLSGRTLLIDGWVVAESEALFCAGLVLSAADTG